MTERDKLLAEREKLVAEIQLLKKSGPGGTAAHHLRFFNEDLLALAAKVLSIDRKLGRQV